ncbi:MAG TPA: hypothetical protein VK034_06680 [Enhygromyxa sp.]|nr:hypothetical protein [Enhygromyxa sp.]
MRISEHSWRVLVELEERRFEDACVEHVARYFPGRARSMDAETLRLCVRSVDERARSLGLTGRRDRLLFLTLCARHGWDFEERPENGWARAMLRDPLVTDPSARLRRLARALDRLRGAE